MIKQLFTIILIMISTLSFSQVDEIIHLWPVTVPGNSKVKQPPVVATTTEKDGVLRYSEVTDPLLEIWLPEAGISKKAGVIICPGGGYSRLAYDKEGTEIAQWLNKQGIAGFVLQYRIPQKKAEALQDAQRAMRIVRSNASKWNIDQDKIGIMGFSAGGDLAYRTSTKSDIQTYPVIDKADSFPSLPDFTILIYPAQIDENLEWTSTPELKIAKGTKIPPMFIFQTADDGLSHGTIVLALAYRDAKIPMELHIYPTGGHGYGRRPGNPAAETWPGLAEKWLNNILQTAK